MDQNEGGVFMMPRYSRGKKGRPPKGDQSSADENTETLVNTRRNVERYAKNR